MRQHLHPMLKLAVVAVILASAAALVYVSPMVALRQAERIWP